MKKTPFIKLFIRPWCGWCDEAKEWLEEHDFPYQEVDIEKDSQARSEMLQLSGQGRVPTAVIDGKVLADFDSGQLEDFLQQLGYIITQ